MVQGSCLCGGIQFEVTEVRLIVLCHCSICRKANGAAFESGAAIPTEDFRITKGADLIQIYQSSPRVQRAFCRVCGSRAPSPSQGGKIYFVPAGLFDGDPGVKPALHMFVGSKAPWWDIDDDLSDDDGVIKLISLRASGFTRALQSGLVAWIRHEREEGEDETVAIADTELKSLPVDLLTANNKFELKLIRDYVEDPDNECDDTGD